MFQLSKQILLDRLRQSAFNELDKRTRNGFSENTLVMSGVSGGAVGIANYASILNENGGNAEKKDKAIFDIGI